MRSEMVERILRYSLLVAAGMVVVGLLVGEMAAALGFGIGGGIGLLSLWSFAIVIPRLAGHDSDVARFWLAFLLLVKLPLYSGILIVAMTSPLVAAFAVFAGASVVPCVIIGCTLSAHSEYLTVGERLPGAR